MKEKIEDYFKQLQKTIGFEKDFEEEEYKKIATLNNPKERVRLGSTWYPVDFEIIEESDNFFELEIIFETLEFPHKFKKAQSVFIFSNQEIGKKISGEIKQIQKNKMNILIEVDELPDWIFEGKIGIEIGFNTRGYDESLNAFQIIQNSKIPEIQMLRNIILDLDENYLEKKEFQSANELNESQNNAVEISLRTKYISLIQGPPGTGKTTTLISLIEKIEGQILFSAPSNSAVDLVVELLNKKNISVLRIGNPIRISETCFDSTLDAKIKNHSDFKTLKKYKEDLQQLIKQKNKFIRNFNREAREERSSIRKEIGDLKKTIFAFEKNIREDIFSKSKVIASTVIGIASSEFSGKIFDTLIMDEASQLSEPFAWVGISRAKKLILCGDQEQLPPVVKSEAAKKKGLEVSLLEKLFIQENSSIPKLFLNTQYRMNDTIMQFSNIEFYNSLLSSHETNKTRDMESVLNAKVSIPTIIWIDTSGMDYKEETLFEQDSFFNLEEIELIKKYLEQNQSKYPPSISIGIISPYSMQVEELKKNFIGKNISVNTIDSFQGREKDVIILSLVRSNDRFEIGFLKEYRRMNVALTRAKLQLVLIGDAETIGKDNFYKRLISYIEANGEIISGWDYYS
jgi:ATP-dependent RNA/DNA helicase IGHMBP2